MYSPFSGRAGIAGGWFTAVGPTAIAATASVVKTLITGLDTLCFTIKYLWELLKSLAQAYWDLNMRAVEAIDAILHLDWEGIKNAVKGCASDMKKDWSDGLAGMEKATRDFIQREKNLYSSANLGQNLGVSEGASGPRSRYTGVVPKATGAGAKTWSEPQTEFQKAQAELQNRQAQLSLNDQDAMSLEEEADFWQKYCARIKAGAGEASKDYQSGVQELARAKRQLHDQKQTGTAATSGGGGQSESNEFKTALEEEVAAERAAGVDTKRYEWQRWNDRLAALQAGSREYQEALREVNRLSREIAREEAKAEEERRKETEKNNEAILDAERSHKEAGIALQEEEVRAKKELGQISASEELTQIQALEDQKYEIEQAAVYKRLELKRAAGELERAEETKLYAQIRAIQDRQALSRLQTANKVKAQEVSVWKSLSTQISSSMTNAITSMLTGTQSMANSLKNIWNQIASTIINKILTISLQYLLGEQTRTAATTAGTVARDGIQDAGYATGLAKQAATGGKAVMNDAYQAYSGAYASASQIPYVGWILGPIAGAAAFAAVAAMSVLSSAAGGWGEVPSDQLAMVHKREMVLPARIAETVRSISNPAALMRDAFTSAMAPALSASGSSSALSAVNPLKGALTSALAPALSLASTGAKSALSGVGSWGIPGDKLQFLGSVSRGEVGKSFASHSSSVSNQTNRSGNMKVHKPVFNFPSNLADLVKANPDALYKGIRDGIRHGHIKISK